MPFPADTSLVESPDSVSLALETNGRGYIGFVVELAGAFVRGRTADEALVKVGAEVNAYMRWLGVERTGDCPARVVQTSRTELQVEDADSEMLVDADATEFTADDFERLSGLVEYSGETFLVLYANSVHKDWADPARVRKTFWGDNPFSIRMIFEHVARCHYYYLSRLGVCGVVEGSFTDARRFSLESLAREYAAHGNGRVFEVEGERWTLKKAMRRFVWHDRIHGKAIVRILMKQRSLGLISAFHDPFRFNL